MRPDGGRDEEGVVRGTAMAAGLLATLGVAGVGVSTVVDMRSGLALPGTTVAGIDVAGLDRVEIAQAVSATAQSRTSGALDVVAATRRVTLDRAQLVDGVDLPATADAAVAAGRNSYPFAGVFGPLLPAGTREVDLSLQVDDAAVRASLEALAAEVDVPPSPGGFLVEGTTVTPGQPQPGRILDQPDAADRLRQALVDGRSEPLPLPVEQVDAGTTPADVQRVTEQARRALAAPYRLQAGDAAVDIGPDQVAPLLGAPVVDGDLELQVSRPGLRALVAAAATGIDRPASDAGFEVRSSPAQVTDKGSLTWRPQPADVVVVPGAQGRQVDLDAATEKLAELVLAGTRTDDLPVVTTEPELNTAEAQSAGVTSLIGTFTTSYTAGQPRARNIARIAEIVDRTYLAPGQVFSLNDTAGERTRARGFAADGAIINGELVDQVGGGVSQFATTLFNAAFFAGLPILEHQPHSFYISRYPAGRESTVFFGQIDVRFRNDTDHGILVETSSTRSSVTVALYGDNGGREVTAAHGSRQRRRGGGFSIAVTRTVEGGDGRGERRVFSHRYDPPPDD